MTKMSEKTPKSPPCSTIISFISKVDHWLKRTFFGYAIAYIAILVLSVLMLKITVVTVIIFMLCIGISVMFFHMEIKYGLRYDPEFGKKYLNFGSVVLGDAKIWC